MGKIPQETIDRILDQLDIVEVVAEYIQLKKAGRNFKACCPFHNEKTPSFMVSPDKQIYHCFGCDAGGNVIGFVMKYENMGFPEAVETLAAKAGVELPRYDKRDDGESSLTARLYEINTIAAGYYQDNLGSGKGKGALEYLERRGLNADTLAQFRIGYATAEWEGLQKYCAARNIPAEILRKAGLSVQSEKGKGDYDRFRKRIIFPIFNERGNIVAFGARVMDDIGPKYINSPETVIYSKSSVLYGLNFSRRAMREKGHAFIVEGYMDVIIPFQNGITNIVAASGTALTPRQAAMLKKYADTAVMVFDSDQAGEAASLRGLDILIDNDVNVRVAALPPGEDPDSFVKKHGARGFEDIADKAKDLFDYKLDLLTQKFGGEKIRDKAAIAGEMLPTISRVKNAIVKSAYLKKLAERLGVNESALRDEMKKVKNDYSYRAVPETTDAPAPWNYVSSEIHLLGLVISDKDMFETMRTELGLHMFRDENIKKVMGVIEGIRVGDDTVSPGKVLSRLEGDERAKAAVIRAVAKADITEDGERVFRDCMACMRKENRKEELKTLTHMLKQAEKDRNDPEIRELLMKINRIYKEKTA